MDLASLAPLLSLPRDLRRTLRVSLAFQLLLQLVAFAFIVPLVTIAARRLVSASGEDVVSNYDLASFALSLPGVLLIVTLTLLASGALLIQLAGQTCIAGLALAGQRATLRGTTAAVSRLLAPLARLTALVLVRLALIALPFVAALALVWYSCLRTHDINYYLSARPPEWQRALLLAALVLVLYAVAVVAQVGRWLFALPILIFEGQGARAALAASVQRTRGAIPRTLVPLAAWVVLVLGVGLGVAGIAHRFEAWALEWAGLGLGRVAAFVAFFLLLGFLGFIVQQALLVAGVQFLVMRRYAGQRAGRWGGDIARLVEPRRRPRMLAVGVLVVLAGYVLAGRIAAAPEPGHAVAVTAHRGDVRGGPENTLAAFRAALAAHADYVELDVQRTRDGAVVVFHDRDLMRMARDPRRIGEMTLGELSQVELTGGGGEHVPTLVSVIALARGHLKLNVELKYNVRDEELAPAAVEVLRREDFLGEAVVTSLNAAALRQVRALEPRLPVGLIVTAAAGNVARVDADFLSLNAARASVPVIRRVHAAGKGVHVWTVNRGEAMLRMIERGVDNLITDDPGLAVRVLAQYAALEPAERLALHLRALYARAPSELTDPAAVPEL